MKQILLLMFTVIISSQLIAQDWKTTCVTPNGDTLRVGDSIKIVTTSTQEAYEAIRPRFNYKGSEWHEYKRHLAFMLGNTYAVSEMSRLAINRKKGEYVPMLIIKDTHASDYEKDVEYTVRLDKAFEKGVIQVIHATGKVVVK